MANVAAAILNLLPLRVPDGRKEGAGLFHLDERSPSMRSGADHECRHRAARLSIATA
jgi:hypothetical protein